jgi:hypothetical protein
LILPYPYGHRTLNGNSCPSLVEQTPLRAHQWIALHRLSADLFLDLSLDGFQAVARPWLIQFASGDPFFVFAASVFAALAIFSTNFRSSEMTQKPSDPAGIPDSGV